MNGTFGMMEPVNKRVVHLALQEGSHAGHHRLATNLHIKVRGRSVGAFHEVHRVRLGCSAPLTDHVQLRSVLVWGVWV